MLIICHSEPTHLGRDASGHRVHGRHTFAGFEVFENPGGSGMSKIGGHNGHASISAALDAAVLVPAGHLTRQPSRSTCFRLYP
ncbi:hypothetical protein [Rhodococcoides fascians]|uniref:hypothetical protein n=1 Tax=Rhodococcoides fascians TaxID=1828 RepID=UPI000A85E29A|nr:hypothetical protein [Rhodococcus fascians]